MQNDVMQTPVGRSSANLTSPSHTKCHPLDYLLLGGLSPPGPSRVHRDYARALYLMTTNFYGGSCDRLRFVGQGAERGGSVRETELRIRRGLAHLFAPFV